MQHTALWSCTHLPNIIDLSGKTKKLLSGQASLRRSRRSGSVKFNKQNFSDSDNCLLLSSNILKEKNSITFFVLKY
jgi:hypothetical protein